MTDDKQVQLAQAHAAAEAGDLSGLLRVFVALDGAGALAKVEEPRSATD